MSDEGEKTCPLCAEEMDMTDQQLKPCKCGYDICVWCWHHIMEMAEKEESDGRCPACRTPYNKEKIVGTTASCGRVVSEMNVEKKLKSSKAKNKSSESRKHLASVRVIQRNLVYVVGLPLSFADEDLLQRRDYFGQYGKVTKVSISRTASGAIQHFANSTCSVYITYSKEEEAVRCIQSVHGFVLDGKPLRACFGTTKYCHAWLRNVSCSNPDCLYLHEIGSQEDSFTKDEIVSAYTRSRVQHITGSSNGTQRHSGNLLPPPADEYCNNTSASSGKPITKSAVNTNISSMGARVSPPNSSSGGSAALPAGASWGSRASNNHPLHTSTNFSNGPLKKADTGNVPVACSEAVSQNQLSSCHGDSGLIRSEESMVPQNKIETEAFKLVGKESSADGRVPFSDSSFAPVHSDNFPVNRKPQGSPATMLPPNDTNIVESSVISSRLASEKASINATDGNLEDMCSDILSMGIHDNNILENDYGQNVREGVTSQISVTAADTSEEVGFRVAQSDFRLGLPKVTKINVHDREDDMLSFTNQRLKDPEVSANRTLDFSHASYLTRHTDINSPEYSKADASICLDRPVIDKSSNIPSGYSDYMPKPSEIYDVERSDMFPSKEKRSSLGRYESESGSDAVDMGESSIISNILSIDFDPWDESLTSPQNLAKLLGDNDKEGSFSVPGSRRNQNSNQSRFSFAREEECKSQFSGFGQSVDYFAKGSSHHPFGHESSNSNYLHIEKFDGRNGFPIHNGMESEIFTGSHSNISSNRNPVSRSQVSAPPGFLAPNRPPPPGFPSHDRTDQVVSGNHLPDASLLRHIQAPSSADTISNGDIEFMDPAILAVGKGTLPCRINSIGVDFSSGYSSQYEDARFQSFVQRSLPSHQNQRYKDLGESFSPLGDAYRVPSRVMEQAISNNISPFSQFTLSQSRNGMISNGQWDAWNEVQAGNNLNNLGMAELLRNERLAFNKFYGSYEDSKIRMPSSGNLYNEPYGI